MTIGMSTTHIATRNSTHTGPMPGSPATPVPFNEPRIGDSSGPARTKASRAARNVRITPNLTPSSRRAAVASATIISNVTSATISATGASMGMNHFMARALRSSRRATNLAAVASALSR